VYIFPKLTLLGQLIAVYIFPKLTLLGQLCYCIASLSLSFLSTK